MFLRWLDMGIIRSFFCSTMGVTQLKLRFMMGHTTSSRTGITPDWLRLFTMGKGNYSHTRYVCMPVDIIIKGLHNCRDSNRQKKEASHRTCTLGSFFWGQQFLVWISSFCSFTPVLWNLESWDFSSSFCIFWVFETGKFGWLFLQVKTEADLITAISAAEKEKDSLCFIEVFLNKDDTSKELLEWGSRVATANGRPHNPQ